MFEHEKLPSDGPLDLASIFFLSTNFIYFNDSQKHFKFIPKIFKKKKLMITILFFFFANLQEWGLGWVLFLLVNQSV